VLSRKLLQRPDVIFTPHLAFNSREALRRILDTSADNIEGYLLGKPRNLVPGSPTPAPRS
jgi:D-lactate dehydrogenase